MALSDTFTPPIFYFQIIQGAHFHLELPALLDAETGEPFDFTSDPAGEWTAEFKIAQESGGALVSFDSAGGSGDGSATLGSDGIPELDLADNFTAGLAPTANLNGGNVGGTIYGDLILTDPASGERWVVYSGRGTIRKQVAK